MPDKPHGFMFALWDRDDQRAGQSLKTVAQRWGPLLDLVEERIQEAQGAERDLAAGDGFVAAEVSSSC